MTDFLENLMRDPNVNNFYGNQPYDRNDPYANLNPYAYSGMSPEDMPADKLYAQLTRMQLRDYQERFQPSEDFLASQITATGTGRGCAVRGGGRRDAGQLARGQSNRFRERYGLSAAPRTTGDANATASALVGGLNMTRARDSDRQQALLTGGLGGIAQQARNSG